MKSILFPISGFNVQRRNINKLIRGRFFTIYCNDTNNIFKILFIKSFIILVKYRDINSFIHPIRRYTRTLYRIFIQRRLKSHLDQIYIETVSNGAVESPVYVYNFWYTPLYQPSQVILLKWFHFFVIQKNLHQNHYPMKSAISHQKT